MDIENCQLKRKGRSTTAWGPQPTRSNPLHGLGGEAPEEAVYSVCLRYCLLCNVEPYKDASARDLKGTTHRNIGVIVLLHGSPNKRKHVPHPEPCVERQEFSGHGD
jgi:hypothetical protein